MKGNAMKRIMPLLLALILIASAACTKVESNEVGVRVINVPLVNGIQHESLTTGYWGYLPWAVTFYKLPRTNRILKMMEEAEEALRETGSLGKVREQAAAKEQQARMPQSPEEQLKQVEQQAARTERFKIVTHVRPSKDQSVRIKTADGNDAWVDIIVSYHIKDKDAYLVAETFEMKNGLDELDLTVESMVRGAVRSWLGGLDSKQILRAEDRTLALEGKVIQESGPEAGAEVKEKMNCAIDELNQRLGDYGLEIVSLSAPTVAIHPEYEAVLNKKRVAEERRKENISRQLEAVQKKQTKINNARGEADSMIALANGRAGKVTQEADAELAAKTMEAKAQEIKYNTLADGIAAQTAALTGPGGSQQVSLAITQAIQGKKIIIVPGQGAMNVLDLNELIQNYGAIKAIELNKTAAPLNQPANPPAPAPGPAGGQ
ncbi:MAG TPA: SPFH domain-containing protein [bacterium]|nr:SPFH domain-containing protein [bacterium]